jgi:hypothetical protein
MSPIRSFLRKRSPTLYFHFSKVWKDLKKQRLRKLLHEYTSRYGWIIHRGPFKGQKLTPYNDERLPILIGSYEDEIHNWAERIIKSQYDTIINIGAGTGSYAVGLALRMPNVHVLAYEGNSNNQELCKNNAKINNVSDRIEILGFCDNNELKKVLRSRNTSERVLILCDCEGCEFELFSPSTISFLKSVDLLIELHRHKAEHLSDLLISNFNYTHQVEIIDSKLKDPNNYPELSMWSRSNQKIALIERRPPNGLWQWIYCIALINERLG